MLFNSSQTVIDWRVFKRGDCTLGNPLQALLDLPEQEKRERGLLHTPAEISQQPETWKTTYQRCQDRLPELKAVLDRAGIRSRSVSPTVYLVGAGTSDYTGRALAAALRQRWGCEVWAIPSTTLLTEFEQYHQPGKEYLWISFSRSGSSPEGVALLERALDQRPQIQHLVITCNQHGAMAELCARHAGRAFALVLDDAANDRGLAMTSSFTNMVVAGQCLANLEGLEAYGEILERMVEAGRQFIPAAAEVASAITALGCSRACFVGAGALRAVADESSLKVVELSAGKVATMAESPLGLRHGPMSSVDGQTLFVAFLSSDARRRGYERDLLEEISQKRLGRIRAVVAANGTDEVASLADFRLSLNSGTGVADEYRPPLDVMLGQLLGLFASLRSGLKPDEPSPSGAITRVVAPIRLYS
jgi:tagatose-6-phosphate ketose/aldose isomerase